MNKSIDSYLIQEIQKLYQESEDAKSLFEYLSRRTNDSSESKVTVLANRAGLEYSATLNLMRFLAELGCGDLILGRKRHPTRFRWSYSLRSLGETAKGVTEQLSEIDPAAEVDWEDDPNPARPEKLSIQEAKLLLAESLGVTPDAIEITIRA